MSGGHYNYESSSVSSLGEDILHDVKKYSNPGNDRYGYKWEKLPDDILQGMREVGEQLKQLSSIAHDIEWFMSGDYGEDTLRQCFEDWRNSNKT